MEVTVGQHRIVGERVAHRTDARHEEWTSGGGRWLRGRHGSCRRARLVALQTGKDDEFALEGLVVLGQVLQHENVPFEIVNIRRGVLEQLALPGFRRWVLERQRNYVFTFRFRFLIRILVFVVNLDYGHFLLAVHVGHHWILGSRVKSIVVLLMLRDAILFLPQPIVFALRLGRGRSAEGKVCHFVGIDEWSGIGDGHSVFVQVLVRGVERYADIG